MKLILVFEQRDPLHDQSSAQWRRLLEHGVQALEEGLNIRLLAANFWREDQHNMQH